MTFSILPLYLDKHMNPEGRMYYGQKTSDEKRKTGQRIISGIPRKSEEGLALCLNVYAHFLFVDIFFRKI